LFEDAMIFLYEIYGDGFFLATWLYYKIIGRFFSNSILCKYPFAHLANLFSKGSGNGKTTPIVEDLKCIETTLLKFLVYWTTPPPSSLPITKVEFRLRLVKTSLTCLNVLKRNVFEIEDMIRALNAS